MIKTKRRYPKKFIIWLLSQKITIKDTTKEGDPTYLIADISWSRLTIDELYEKYKIIKNQN